MSPSPAALVIAEYARRLKDSEAVFGHGAGNAWDEAERLVAGFLRGRALTPALRAELDALLRRRIEERIPTAHLTGEAWFGGLVFHVPPGVMIPRSPLAEVLQQDVRPWLATAPRQVLDLCCGTGALGILAAHQFAEARVDLVDDDPLALQAVRCNLRRHERVANRVEVLRSDLFAALGERCYDLVLANPPYVPSAELAALPTEFGHEPRHGLDGGPDGLAIWRRIVAGLDRHLAPDGVLVGEVGNLAREFDAAFPQLHCVWLDLANAEPQADGRFGVFATVPWLDHLR